MISIFEFTDGYYAVGEEGYQKAFLPAFEQVKDYIEGIKGIESVDPTIVIKIDKTLEQYFRGE